MVAVSFGSYASAAVADGDAAWTKLFAVLVVLVMTAAQHRSAPRPWPGRRRVVVIVVIGILTVFAVATLSNLDPHLLAFSGYPSLRDIVSSVALTFFAFLGFGVITFTAKDLARPRAPAAAGDVPRARDRDGRSTSPSRSGVFGTLTVDEVIASGGTALAVAAEPSLGDAGYWMMSVTALFATAGATNAGLYPAAGLCEQMATIGQFPPVLGRRLGGRAPVGLAAHRGRGDRARRWLRPDRDRLDRQRGRPDGLHARLGGPPPGPERDRREGLAAGPRRRVAVVVLVTFAFAPLVEEPGPRSRWSRSSC